MDFERVQDNEVIQRLGTPTVDHSREAPWSQRVMGSLKATPQGEINYLRSIYGDENVIPRESGIFLRDEKGMFPYDKQGPTINDFVADPSGFVVEAGPSIAAGVATANPWAAAAAGGVGNALRQGVSALAPGDDEMSLGDRATSFGLSTALAGGSQYGFNALAKGYDNFIRPTNVVKKMIARQADDATRAFTQEGDDLIKQTGVELTPEQLTGSRFGLRLKGLLRQHPATADKVLKQDLLQAQQAVTKLGNIMDDYAKGFVSPDHVGQTITGTYKKAISAAVKARRSQATVDFGDVAKVAGNKPIVQTNNVTDEIVKVIDDFDVAGGDATQSMVRQLKGMLNQLPDEGLTANQVQRYLQVYGKAAAGKGRIFSDLDTAQERLLSGKIYRALLKDMDEAAETTTKSAAAKTALRKARDNYRELSQPIDELKKNTVGRLLNMSTEPTPESVSAKFLTMSPTEIHRVAKVMDNVDPEAMNQVRRYVVQASLDAAEPANAISAPGAVNFSPRKWRSFFGKHNKQNLQRMQAIFDAKGYKELKALDKQLARIVDRAGMEGSQTFPMKLMWDTAKSVFMLDVSGIGAIAPAVLLPRQLATAMSTGPGRQALFQLAQTPATSATKQSMRAIAYLSALGVVGSQQQEP